MPHTGLGPGPYRTIPVPDGSGASAPYYIIPFDKRGACSGPQTRAHLIDAAGRGGFTDVFLFSHGWNNDWTVATGRYEHFMQGYMQMRRDHGLAARPGYKPLLVGVFWPSTALTLTEAERGPRIAAGDPDAVDEAVADERAAVQALAEDLAPDDAETFYALAQKDELTADEATTLAELLRPLFTTGPGEEPVAEAPSVNEILGSWATLATDDSEDDLDLDDFGTPAADGAAQPQIAGLGGLLRKLDPRAIVRAMTVWKMKTRAGTVGGNGVNRMLRELLQASSAQLHLIGHSYGGKVMLSAIGNGPALPRPVTSLLLLQPAVSHLCFADSLPGTGEPGGYRPVLDRVTNPILSTFSKHDAPLTKTFHLALRRESDLGDIQIAAAGDPPSKYAALGGFGPRQAGEQLIDIKTAGKPYDLDPNVKVYGLRGDDAISGHGDISNPATWWALYSLASR